MYNSPQFKIDETEALLTHIGSYGFGFLVSASDDPSACPFMTPLPMLVSENVLYGHVSKANPHWRLLDGARLARAFFPGPHGYVSPLWYPDPTQAVPTWNYTLVSATGRPSVISDVERVDWVMETLISQYEGPDGWSIAIADDAFRRQQQKGIVVFEMPIDTLEGKAKLSQNKPGAVATALSKRFREAGNTELAAAMDCHNAGR